MFFSSRRRHVTAIYCKIVGINTQIYSITVDVASFSAYNLHNYTIPSGNEYLVQLYCKILCWVLSKHLLSNLNDHPTNRYLHLILQMKKIVDLQDREEEDTIRKGQKGFRLNW